MQLQSVLLLYGKVFEFMARLDVSKFSCINNASFELAQITVLIGPQASGKSVLCKLCYFFVDILQQQARLISDGASFDTYKDFVKETFHEWFPLSAWGSDLFVIEFKAGDCEFRLSRTSYRGVAAESIRIWTSEAVKTHYAGLVKLRQNLSRQSKATEDELDFMVFAGLHDAAQKSLTKLLGDDYVSWQLFVPAGRSFFTSVGKAVAAFEHGRILDPFILNFGRMYAQLRDRNFRLIGKRTQNLAFVASIFNDIFGGELKSKGNDEYVLSKDGRRIPLSALSSGQQELLPLITVLPRLMTNRADGNRVLSYIEEPEAHLFPGAQSKLIEALGALINHSAGSVKMVLTTHSPYVLSKFNNLIKAGQLSEMVSGKQRDELDRVVPKISQMPKGYVRAYAIIDGQLNSIVDDDGLIAADYLDDVSGSISAEFSDLLAMEFGL